MFVTYMGVAVNDTRLVSKMLITRVVVVSVLHILFYSHEDPCEYHAL